MRGDKRRPAPTSIGALTRSDRHREAALVQKIDQAYSNFSTSTRGRVRRRNLRAARRNERALVAQRRRPRSVLVALAFAFAVSLAALVALRATLTLSLVVAALFVIDLTILRHRRRVLRRR
jgi:Flp pilus assembly protein TadB